MKKIRLNLPNISLDLVKYLMMIIITLSSIIIIPLYINKLLTINEVIFIIMLFFIYISMFLIIISQNLDKNSKNIIDLIDLKTHVPFTNQIADSKFEFRKMVCSATKSIFILGPNLHFLAKNVEETKEILFQKFKNYPDFHIRMLLSNPDARLSHTETNGLDTETEKIFKFMCKCSFGDKHFKDQLLNSITKFKALNEDFGDFLISSG